MRNPKIGPDFQGVIWKNFFKKKIIKKKKLKEKNFSKLFCSIFKSEVYLARSLEYQKGLQLIANAPDYISNLRDEDNKPIILKPKIS